MKDWIYIEKKIIFSKHNYFCLQFGVEEEDLHEYFSLNINSTRKTDHAGFNFSFTILWFYFYFYIYDHRHWCYKCKDFSSEKCYSENHGTD